MLDIISIVTFDVLQLCKVTFTAINEYKYFIIVPEISCV